jgi:hypothetical protein
MRFIGFLLLLAGAVTYVLPTYFGLSFKFMDVLGSNRDMFAAGLGLIGISLMLFGGRR